MAEAVRINIKIPFSLSLTCKLKDSIKVFLPTYKIMTTRELLFKKGIKGAIVKALILQNRS